MAAGWLKLHGAAWLRRLPAGTALVVALAMVIGGVAVGGIKLRFEALERQELGAAHARLLHDAGRALLAVANDLRGYDNLLDLLADKAQLHRERSEYEPLLDRRLASLAAAGRFGMFQASLVDPAGVNLWSSTQGHVPVDLADREHIQAQMQADAGLFISAPMVGRVSGRWSIQITRRLMLADGSLGGIGVLSVDPEYIATRLREMVGDSEATLALWRADGRLLARSGDLQEALAQGQTTSFRPMDQLARYRRGAGGEDRLLAVQGLPNAPLFLTLSRPTAPELATYRRLLRLEPMFQLAVAVVLLLGTTLVILLLARRERQQQWNAILAQQAATRLREAEMARVLNGMDCALFLCRLAPSGPPRLLFANAHVQDLVGALVGPEDRFPLQSCLQPPLNMAEAETLAATLRESGRATIERQASFGSKGQRWVRCSFNLLADSTGAAEVIGRIDDIQTEKAATAAAMSTARLATLGEMATGLAHELTQPLTIISLSAENTAILLQAGVPGVIERTVQRMQDIIAMTRRAKEITDHLRLFGRRQSDDLEAVELRQAVAGALLLVRVALHEADVALEVALPEELPPVLGRQVLLEQVLMNLLLNARDAMRVVPPGQRRIRLAAGLDGAMVWLRLEDSGPGIPPEVLPRLFEPFFTTKPPGEGTGLGLSICHGIVRSFSGSLRAEAAAGGGACFVITLPAANGAPPVVPA